MLQNSTSSFQYVFFPDPPSNNFILRLSTWIEHQIPQVKGSVLQDCPSPHLGCQFQVQVVTLCFWPTGYKSKVPTTPSLGTINLLKQFTTLREIFDLLGHRFIRKDTALEQPERRDAYGKVCGKDVERPCFLHALLSTYLQAFTNPGAHQVLLFQRVLDQKLSWLSLPLPRGWWERLEVPVL